MRHASIRNFLSAYLDGELDDSRTTTVRAHLQACQSCQARLEIIREGKQLASHFEFPRWSGAERLWETIREQLSATPGDWRRPRFAERLSSMIQPLLAPTPRVIIATGLALLLIANLVVSFRADGDDQVTAEIMFDHFAFDYGLYLNALSQGRKPTEFELRYDSKPVQYDEAGGALPFKVAPYDQLASVYQLTNTRLITSACCSSLQCSIIRNSREIVLFQQPKEHPIAFGDHPPERTNIAGQWYHKANAGQFQAISWVSSETKFVAVGEMLEEDLASILVAVMSR